MDFPVKYTCLTKNKFEKKEFSIIPIRYKDRLDIMKWRNEQIYHLRQGGLLTEEKQESYFKKTILPHFTQEQPKQILFSFLENDVCVAYGGLVHINWIDKNAEISFVINTGLEKTNFKKYWTNYLRLIEKVAFKDLKIHKIFTYAFDLRPHLYEALTSVDFFEESRLKEHCLFDGKFIDVLIHSKINIANQVNMRAITAKDSKLLFNWANDKDVRENSLNPEPIPWANHQKWFAGKLKSDFSRIYILELKNIPLGQIRYDYIEKENLWLIDYSIDKKERGKGFGNIIITKTLDLFSKKTIKAVVRHRNISSQKVFENNGFALRKREDEKENNQLIEYFYG